MPRVSGLHQCGGWAPSGDSGVSCACSAALSAMPSLFHGTASIAPVTELRRKSTLLGAGELERLDHLGLPSRSATVTLVPAVT